MSQLRNASRSPLVIVVAMGQRTKAIGRGNRLLWSVPDDLKRFAEKTRGKPVIMGRRTFQSIIAHNGKPLPNRPNIVVTRDQVYSHPGVFVSSSVGDAIVAARSHGANEIHIGGGEQLYRQVLPLVEELFVTLIDDDAVGDTYFPDYEHEFVEVRRHGVREHEGLRYEWVDLVRNNSPRQIRIG